MRISQEQDMEGLLSGGSKGMASGLGWKDTTIQLERCLHSMTPDRTVAWQ